MNSVIEHQEERRHPPMKYPTVAEVEQIEVDYPSAEQRYLLMLIQHMYIKW